MTDIDLVDRELADLCDVICLSKSQSCLGRNLYLSRIGQLAQLCTMSRHALINLIGVNDPDILRSFLNRHEVSALRSQFLVSGLPHRAERLVPLWAYQMLQDFDFELASVAQGVLMMSAETDRLDVCEYFFEQGLFDTAKADEYLLFLIGSSGPHNADFMAKLITRSFERNPLNFATDLRMAANIERCLKTISILSFLGVQTHLGHHPMLDEHSNEYTRIANQSTHQRIAFISHWQSLTRILETPSPQLVADKAAA